MAEWQPIESQRQRPPGHQQEVQLTHQQEVQLTHPQLSDPGPGTATPDPVFSCLTTTEHQQNLKEQKQTYRAMKLLFEVPSARVIQHVLSKHVVYQIVVMRSGSYDSRCVSIERRYSDFERFHQQLLEKFCEELEDVHFPRKHLSRNFNPEMIAERRLAFQDYLAQIYAIRCIRYSQHFPEFFTGQEQIRAHGLLRAGQFKAATEQLQTTLDLLEKLVPWQSPTLLVPTLCALAVGHRDLGELEDAFAMAHRALPAVRRYKLCQYRGPLLELLVDVGYLLHRPVAQLQEELSLFRDSERGLVSSGSLKELVVQKFT